MKFEKHAFISYAHIDNKPISDEDEGWISDFHASLESLVSMKLGENVKIWRDNKLKGLDIFSDEIVQQFPKTALFISVISPRYINSEWCTKEIKEFYKAATQNLGIRVENKSRILKVIKTPVNREKMPEEIAESLGYEFFKLDENGRPKEFNKIFGGEAEQAYLNRVDDLAYDIQEIINMLNEARDETVPDNPAKDISTGKKKLSTIYVAQTSYELLEARDQLVRELKGHGYEVLPDTSLSIYADQFKQEVSDALDKSQLAIHLVGKLYGGIPDGPEEKSAIILQNEIAAEKCKTNTLSRMIWIANRTGVQDERQREFIQNINENEDAQRGADVIEGSLEVFKSTIFDKLRQLENPNQTVLSDQESSEKKIFLICDAKDRAETLPIRKFLISKQLEVNIPLFEGDSSSIRNDLEENLKSCDAILLFYGNGDEYWKRSKMSEIKKINSYQREKPLLATYTYLADPDTVDKIEMIELGMENVINGMGGFSPELMNEFLKKIEQVSVL
ncbi:toll/interleukin-1 receptor domain-containing protein [Catalinimonas sp. 4WD22]|uniref:toll/interleukin-1 receptor domain-containing protein n=1 Tax=Catalinimonas locisalis TaxID=3133978 RepID=UPI003101B2F1